MVIKHQDVLDGLDRAVVYRQQASLLHDENPSVEGGRLGDGRSGIEITAFAIFPDELARGRHRPLRKVTSFHDSHRTTATIVGATTRASDFQVTHKESARLLLSVDGPMRSTQGLKATLS
jgi:hypothetical protein